MAAQGAYSVTIKAVDNTNSTLNAINKRLRAMNAPYEKLNRSMAEFTKASGLRDVGRAFGEVGRSAGDALGKIQRIVEPLAAIAGITSIAGIYKMTEAWASWGSQLTFSSHMIGMSASRLNDWQHYAQLAGSSAEDLTNGLSAISEQMTEVQRNPGTAAAQYFQQMGVSLKELKGPVENILPKLTAFLTKLNKTNPQLAKKVINSLGAPDSLLRLFGNGQGAVDRGLADAGKFGGETNKQIAQYQDLLRAQAELGMSTQRLRDTLAGALAPALIPVIKNINEWLSAHQVQIAERMGAAVKRVTDTLKNGGWKRIKDDAETFRHAIESVVKAVGGLQNALEILFALMVARFAITMLAPFVSLGLAIGKATWKLGEYIAATQAAQAASLAAPAEAAAAGTAARTGVAAVAGSGIASVITLAASAAVIAATAYFTAHGLSWLFGSGWNDPGAKGPTANAANRGSGAKQTAAMNDQARSDIATLMGLGRTRREANIIEGNFAQESGLDAQAQNRKSGAYGLAQWLGPRVAQFAQVEGTDLTHSTRAQQLHFADWELKHTERASDMLLKRQTREGEGAGAFGQAYERYGAGEDGYRAGYAEQFANLQVPQAAPASSGGTVKVHVSADPGLRAKVLTTTGAVQAGVARTSLGTDHAT